MRVVRIISLLLLLSALCSCAREPVVGEAVPQLSVTLDIPSVVLTRADEGEAPARGRENDLHDLRLWVFTSSDRAAVGYLEIQEADFPTHGEARQYAIPVSRAFADERPKVDVFVLANQASVGLSLGASATWQALNGASFGGTYFGPEEPISEVSAETGLPMSGLLLNASVEGREPELSVPTVKLRRCVSKIRFLFSRTQTEDGDDAIEDVSVNAITIAGNRIPLNEYVFASSGSRIAPGGYTSSEIHLGGRSTIALSEAPEKYSYAQQDATSYENLLDEGVARGELTEGGSLYLRESDRQITGTIEYSITKKNSEKEDKTKSFSMVAPGHFIRNHSWTVYGYFLSGRNLSLGVHVDDWDRSEYSVDFSEQAITVLQKFSVIEHSADLEEVEPDVVDVYLLPGTPARGSLIITTPVGGQLFIRPEGDVSAFEVSPSVATINPDLDNGRIDISVKRNPNAVGNLTGKSITLSFTVETGDREASADSEIIDKQYRFIL